MKSMAFKIKDKKRMPIIVTSSQHCHGVPKQYKEKRQNEWKRGDKNVNYDVYIKIPKESTNNIIFSKRV